MNEEEKQKTIASGFICVITTKYNCFENYNKNNRKKC